ncbi:hypothetical protein C9374_009659 [Naegleria lovaniensis]|uniref:Uncharacterized protein n=1 Tax=Naegleria lovaniensis TaxID=51637 RepID=A0AA88KRB0_NAELO|nr:uncharacterized protein C9374_009659 [Naegleria lovaniensis]KAG2393082.1 hypothetical protein C9374_009659 [Naegleria lovaniensis]
MINNTPNTTTKENTIYIISKTDISSDDTMEIMGKIRDSAMTQIPKVPRTKPNVMIVTTHAHEYEETLNSLYKYGISTGTFIASPSTMPQGETFSKIECKSPNKAYIQEKIGMLIQILKSQKVKNIYTNLYVSNDTFTLIVGHTDSNVITTIVNKSKGVFVEIPKPFITRSSEEFHKSGICCFPEQTSPNDIKEAIKKSLEISQVDFDENKLNITKLKSNYSSGGYYYKAIYICNDQEDLKKLCNQLITMKTNTTPSAASYLIIKRFKPLAEQNNSSTPIKHSQGNNQELGSAKYVENKLEQHDQKLHDMKTSMESIQKDMIEVKQILSKLPELIQQTVSLYVSKENDKRKSTNLSPRDGAGKKAKRTVEVDMFDDEF